MTPSLSLAKVHHCERMMASNGSGILPRDGKVVVRSAGRAWRGGL